MRSIGSKGDGLELIPALRFSAIMALIHVTGGVSSVGCGHGCAEPVRLFEVTLGQSGGASRLV